MPLFFLTREHSVILATQPFLSRRKFAAQMLPWTVRSLATFLHVIPDTDVIRSSLRFQEGLQTQEGRLCVIASFWNFLLILTLLRFIVVRGTSYLDPVIVCLSFHDFLGTIFDLFESQWRQLLASTDSIVS